MSPDEEIARIAEGQFSLVTTAQLRSVGVSNAAASRRARTGRLIREAKGVYRLPGSPHSRERMLLAAQLAVQGGVLSHRSAGYLCGINGIRPVRPELIVPIGTTTTRSDVIAYRRRLDPQDRTTRGVFRLTTASRTLSDLASILEVGALEVAVDDAVTRGVTTLDALYLRVAGRHQGVAGVTALRPIVLDRIANGVPASHLETVALRRLRDAGLPRPISQYEIFRTDGSVVARPDLVYPEIRLAIELDGDRYHATKQQRTGDRIRQNTLTEVGYAFLRFGNQEVRTGEMVRSLCSYLRGSSLAAQRTHSTPGR